MSKIMIVAALAAGAAMSVQGGAGRQYAAQSAPQGIERYLTSDVPAQRQWYEDDPADSLYKAARTALTDGKYRDAVTLFRRVRERYPDSSYVPDALYFEAFALDRLGGERNWRAALAALDERRQRFPRATNDGDVGALETRIQGRLAKRGDPNETRRIIERAESTGSGCNDADADMRIAALDALMQMDAERAMPILRQVLAKRDECSVELRKKAVFLVAQKAGDEAASILLATARQDPESEVRADAVFWLSQVGGNVAVAALDSILHNTQDDEVVDKAIFALSNTGSPRAMQILRTYAESNAPDELRAKAIFWIGQNGRRYPENAEFLRRHFDRERNDEIQGALVQAIAQAATPEDMKWLLDIASDEKRETEVRKNALFWASQSNRLDLTALVNMYSRLKDDEVKEHFIFVLAQRRESEATDKLFDIAQNDPDREMRKKALFWLGQKNDPRVRELLLKIINQ
ncbi:MAG TPA: HEAT repeat domain-containing protein [Gemmatimonadaceae bacterium]|nr:HEAT repeat domain-containing protein [Gemmatimonadaceae bacterium]